MENPPQKFTGKRQENLFSTVNPSPGSMNDSAMIRATLVDSIRKSGKSRAQIADEMTLLVGWKITERMLNGYTAESRDEYRWPAELTRSFCQATGDDRLLTSIPEAAGLRVISSAEADLLELGRSYLLRKRADRDIADLEHRLEGVPL